MGRNTFGVSDVDYLLWIDGYRPIAISTDPVHLTLWWTNVPPRVHPKAAIRRGRIARWSAYWCFVSAHPVEQNEPGDTLTHTFDLFQWPIGEKRWFTFKGTIYEVESRSITGIFEKQYDGSFLFVKNPSFEFWKDPSLLPDYWLWTDYTTWNVNAFRDGIDLTQGMYSLRMQTNGYIPYRTLYQEIDAVPYRGLWLWIRPDMKGAPIYTTGLWLLTDGTPPVNQHLSPASAAYWSAGDIFRKCPLNATKIRIGLMVDSFWHVPSTCRFDNIRSCAIP